MTAHSGAAAATAVATAALQALLNTVFAPVQPAPTVSHHLLNATLVMLLLLPLLMCRRC
jgi:hypothetical protein